MKILTVRQPFASAILASVGAKDIENRFTPIRLRGRIGIHAGKQWHEAAVDFDKQLPRGAVLGTIQLVGCHPAGAGCAAANCHENHWANFATENQRPIFHWELDHPRRFVTPIKCLGALGFWTPGPSIEHLIEIAEVEA